MPAKFTAADLFCGAGGTSAGLIRAAAERGIPLDLLAINHWPVAVETHQRNHPWARHMCADLSSVDPSKAIPGGRLDLLVASPECTHHSIARGGKPCSDQSRASAWHVVHWAERLEPRDILIENVREFESWGPLTRKGRPNKRLKGRTFQAFVAALHSLGYTVDWRVLNAADFGDATSRRRLFVRASRTGKIRWPEPTHAGRWRGAREIIDWRLRGASIFGRKKPLRHNTLRRIEAGLKKFGGEKFVVLLRGTRADQEGSWSRSVDAPLTVISAGGVHAGICEPFVMQVAHAGADASRCKSTDHPLPAIPAGHRGELAICQPFIVQTSHTKTTGRSKYIRSVNQPLTTITGRCEHALLQPFLVEYHGSKRDQDEHIKSIDQPLPVQTAENRFGLCQPFLTKYYSAGAGAKSVDEPLDTVTAHDRFALVEPGRMDICFRMLQPHELAAAMGFDDYQFCGSKTDQVRQIGNAVAVRTAQALCGAILC